MAAVALLTNWVKPACFLLKLQIKTAGVITTQYYSSGALFTCFADSNMVLPFQLIFSWNRTWAWLPPLGTLCDRGVSDMMDWWLQMGKALLHAVC